MTNSNPQLPIVVVDDESSVLKSFEFALNSHGWDNVICIQDSRQLLPLLQRQPVETLILDLTMPYISGTDILEKIREDYPEIPVIVITGLNDVKIAVQCMKLGAVDYLLKPVERSRLGAAVGHVVEMQELKRQNHQLKQQLLMGPALKNPEAFEAITTRSPRMCAIFHYIEALAPSREPILITGATGTGKELLARSAHAVYGGPFIAVNVAGLDDQVFSDTLFGHHRGAFTDAVQHREGLVEQAAGGILFLDEIGDLSLQSQVKLLRLIQEHEYYPLGSDLPRKSDARMVVATNLDLRQRMESGQFRRDLFYRLSVHHISLPSLKQRREDIPLLVDLSLKKAAAEMNRPVPTVPDELYTLLNAYHFPGNVRELRSMVFDACSRHRAGVMSLDAFREALRHDQCAAAAISGDKTAVGADMDLFSACDPLPTVKEVENHLIAEAMHRAGDNQGIAARLLGISRQTLNVKLKKIHEKE